MSIVDITPLTVRRCAEASRDAYRKYSLKNTETDTEVYIEHFSKQTIVAVRGTSSWKDVKQDLKRTQSSTPEGGIHSGFKQCCESIFPQIVSKLAKTEVPVVFTGHSLGGAVAQILATMYDGDCSCITFGSPRVGDKEFCQNLVTDTGGKLLLVEHGMDRVTWVPFFGYTKPKKYIKKVWNCKVFAASAHSISNYVDLTRNLNLK